ncbi:MAG: aspartate 1-decarboxylase [Akkermansiaceae bacterium]|nr:aspartate 1-decarboxylase [Akkermansiaceae bacterium]NNM27924.1 aspartate 1-decarboxylase [Akkermansiaceae bacterium]
MLRQVLKSQIHHALISEAAPDRESGIEIPTDLVDAVGLCDGEKVQVESITTGNRLETCVQAGDPRTGRIILGGGAARVITRGERVTITAIGLSHEPVLPQKVELNERNEIARTGA